MEARFNEDLVADGSGDGPGVLAELKADPGRLGLETLLSEIAKLERLGALGADPLFAVRAADPAGGDPPPGLAE